MKIQFQTTLLLLLGIIFLSCSADVETPKPKQVKKDTIITDTINEAFLRDSTLFLTITIGNQTWMKNDLHLTEFLNGDPISEAQNNADWIKFAKQKKPCFRKVGNHIFYNGFAIMDDRGLVPDDFRIPNSSDWDVLINELGGIILMSKSISNYSWTEKGQYGNNDYTGNNISGFNASPSGFVFTDGSLSLGNCNFWWVNSSWQSPIPSKLSIFNIGFCDTEISRGISMEPAFGATLRCIKKKS